MRLMLNLALETDGAEPSREQMETIREGVKSYLESVALPADNIKIVDQDENGKLFSYVHKHDPSEDGPCTTCKQISQIDVYGN